MKEIYPDITYTCIGYGDEEDKLNDEDEKIALAYQSNLKKLGITILFFGFGIISLAHGLQGNLLGLRAVLENFNIIATGALIL